MKCSDVSLLHFPPQHCVLPGLPMPFIGDTAQLIYRCCFLLWSYPSTQVEYSCRIFTLEKLALREKAIRMKQRCRAHSRTERCDRVDMFRCSAASLLF
eukprot:3185959-Pleurochrysis_carterae.AAC.2